MSKALSTVLRRSAQQSPSIHRLFHGSATTAAKKASSSASRGARLAGRLRFYKQVGVIEVAAPWDNDDSDSSPAVESPISAGVDGTKSASGVHHVAQDIKDNQQLKDMLSPRIPGSTESIDVESWYGITLDGRNLKSPMGLPLAVPSKHLAFAIAAEWDAQKKYLQPTQMPLMTLTCTALDQAAMHPSVYREQSLSYLPTDTTCFWADPTEDRVLHRRQEQAWSGLHKFVEKRFEHAPVVAQGTIESMLMARKRTHKPQVGLPHPPPLYEKAEEWTHDLDAWHLVALHSICMQAKSFMVGLALLEQHHADSPFSDDMTKAMDASRVEEEFQIANWGLVEGQHDYDRLNCSVQLHSAQILAKTIAMELKS